MNQNCRLCSPDCNVHYPTDCNLLWDAARKCIELHSQLHMKLDIPGWRKGKLWKKQIRTAMRVCERTASRGGANKDQRVLETAQSYLDKAYALEEKINQSIEELQAMPLSVIEFESLQWIGYFHDMLILHISLVDRRLVRKETIAHAEKVFSLFEPHTELIKKGKAMPPVEFGHRLLVASEQHGLIVDYKVMQSGSESAWKTNRARQRLRQSLISCSIGNTVALILYDTFLLILFSTAPGLKVT